MRRLLPFLVALAATSSLAEPASPAPSLAERRLDLSIPDIPAFTALNVSPTTVSRPGTVREFVSAISNGVTPTGELQTGAAIEVAPIKLLAPLLNAEGAKTLVHYLGGLQGSFATNSVVDGTTTTHNMAFGLRIAPLKYDPYADEDLGLCLASQLPAPPPPEDVVGPTQTIPKTEVAVQGLTHCRDAFRAAHLATTALEFAYVHVMSSENDTHLRTFRSAKDTLWASFSFGLNTFSLAAPPANKDAALVHYQELMTGTPSSTLAKGIADAMGFEPTLYVRLDSTHLSRTERQNDFFGAARLPLIWDGKGLFAELGVRAKNLGRPNENVTYEVPLGLGGEFRLANGTWLGLFFGGDLAGTQGVWVLSNLRWGQSEERPFR